MAGKSRSKVPPADRPRPDDGIYIDSSALAKLYMPEPESEFLDQFLVGRRDLVISDLGVTEVISAVARRKREGALDTEQADLVRAAVLEDAGSRSFRRLDITPHIHRAAERLLLHSQSIPLRTLDALHIALALGSEVKYVITFDDRMSEAATLHGLKTVWK